MATDYQKLSLEMHKKLEGKIEIIGKMGACTRAELSTAYTPGVAEPCKIITQDETLIDEYTVRGNLVAVVSDGSAVLGLGNIGARASYPVMEGKALLFKAFGGVDAWPICVKSQKVDEIVRCVELLEPSFAGINLEDISAPRCFEVEERLKKTMDIPIFHDDQHGTAVVVAGGIINAIKVTGRTFKEVKVVINGAGAAGIATVKMLQVLGAGDIILCDRKGPIYEGRTENMNYYKEQVACSTNRDKVKGTLADAFKGRNLFIGLSGPGLVTKEMVASMEKDPIVCPMANPVPEIWPDEAKAAGARVVATGRSDFDNQINNVLGFPGIFRGALDVRASDINEEMKMAAAYALAGLIPDSEVSTTNIIPSAFDFRVPPAIAAAVAKAAMDSGVARKPVDIEVIKKNTTLRVERVKHLQDHILEADHEALWVK
ncbi:MAG: NAD-dependent malic enzyme [Deltaproteobacteria bacterium]|nr:NAD-dependent malic enzyme [Deltaproteobacteria bacterium]MBW2308041.1 NAD-dependent malic enzyme [Deltaproteobacteria bacterium]